MTNTGKIAQIYERLAEIEELMMREWDDIAMALGRSKWLRYDVEDLNRRVEALEKAIPPPPDTSWIFQGEASDLPDEP